MKRALAFVVFIIVTGIPGVCDTQMEWRRTETEHFVFVYRARDGKAAAELVTFCEEVYALVSRYFDSYPTRIQCALLGDTDDANGACTSFPNAMELNIASPTSPWFGSRTENWLRAVFIHELTHYIHLVSTDGPFAFLSNILGDEVKRFHTPFLHMGWMIEGITVNFETMLTRGGRGRNPYFEVLYRAMVLENRVFSADQASYGSSFPPRGRIYVAGYMIVRYMMDMFGDDVFAKIHRAYIRFPFFGPYRAITAVTGQSIHEILAGMKLHYEKKYAPRKKIAGGVFRSPRGIGDYHLPVVTDKGLIIYRGTPGRRHAIVLVDPATWEEKILIDVDLHDESSLCATENGDTAVFSSGVYDFKSGEHSMCADLFRLKTATGETERITRGGHLYHPAISGDGGRLFAVQRVGSYSRLVEVVPSSGEIRVVYEEKETNVYNPVLSPDARRLAFVRHVRGMQDIFIMDLASSGFDEMTDNDVPRISPYEVHPLFTEDAAGDYYPGFADNGTVYFTSDREGDLSLYSCSIDGTNLLRLMEDPVGVLAGKTAGNELLYESYAADGYCVKSVPLSTVTGVHVSLPEKEEPVAPFDWQAVVGETNYSDLALPLYWFPYPSAPATGGSFDIGVGVYVAAGSLLGKSSWEFSGAFQPRHLQPLIHFYGTLDAGAVTLSLQFDQDYNFLSDENDSVFEQRTMSQAEMMWPAVQDHMLSFYHLLYFRFGFFHVYSLRGDEPFPFTGSGNAGSISSANRLFAFGGTGFMIAKSGSVNDHYPPLGVSMDLTAQMPIPFEGTAQAEPALALDSVFFFPMFVPGHIISPKASALWVGEGLESPGDLIRIQTGLDYHFHIAHFDQPVVYGLSLLRLRGRAYWLYGMLLDIVPGALIPDRSMYGGLELILTIGYGPYYTVPLVCGMRVNFDPLPAGVVPYISINFNDVFWQARDASRPHPANIFPQ